MSIPELIQPDFNLVPPETITATAALEAYTFVDIDGTTSTAGSNTMGIVTSEYDGTSPNATRNVVTLGTYTVIAGAAFDINAELEVGASGYAVEKSVGVVVARAREASLAAGQKVTVFLLPK